MIIYLWTFIYRDDTHFDWKGCLSFRMLSYEQANFCIPLFLIPYRRLVPVANFP